MQPNPALTAATGAAARPPAGGDDGPLPWQGRALCAQADPEAFFPENGWSAGVAKRVCRSCPVRADCLEHALRTDERHGIWGGLSPGERRDLRAPERAAGRRVAAARKAAA